MIPDGVVAHADAAHADHTMKAAMHNPALRVFKLRDSFLAPESKQ